MGCAIISQKAIQLKEQYFNKYGEYPRGWYRNEETMKEYEEFLQKLINEN